MLTRVASHRVNHAIRTRVVAARDGAAVLAAARALADEVRRAEEHPLDAQGDSALADADTLPPPDRSP